MAISAVKLRTAGGVGAEPIVVPTKDDRESPAVDRVWGVVVWNDPVNLMSYVVLVFRKLFGYTEEKATALMLQVHNEGRAVVTSGPLEKAEFECFRLHRHGLHATIERA